MIRTCDTLTFAWTQIDGPPVTLNNASPSHRALTRPMLAWRRRPAFSLDCDGQLRCFNTNYPIVAITVTYVNHSPSADAGHDQR